MFIKLNRRGKNQRFHNNGEKKSLAEGTASGFLKFYRGVALSPFLFTFLLTLLLLDLFGKI